MAGFFSKQIRRMQADFKALSFNMAKESPDGDLYIGKHAKTSKRCVKCGQRHSINEHRFHGPESHIRTHGDESGIGVALTSSGRSKHGSAFKLPPMPEPEARRRAATKKATPFAKNVEGFAERMAKARAAKKGAKKSAKKGSR